MRRLWTLWLAAAVLVLTAVFAASAAAGGGQGHDGKGGDQHASQQQPQQQQQQSPEGQQPSSGGDAGTKPGSDTSKWTKTHVGDKPDVSKRYGNGTTAAEIAKGRGAPDNTVLTGPGNSQPHKVSACGHKDNRSGGVDVHAVKSYSSSDCQTQKPEEQQPVQKPEEQKPTDVKPVEVKQPEVKQVEVKKADSDQEESHKVAICHATGSATNPYVLITVDKHALEHGHTAAKGDIIPAPAGGCPTASTETGSVLGTSATVCGTEQATSGDESSKDEDKAKGDERSQDDDKSQGDEKAKESDDQAAEDNDAGECGTSSTESPSVTPAPVAPAQVTVTPSVQQSAAATATVTTTTTATTTPTTTVAVSTAQAATQSAPTAAATPQGQGQVLGATANLTPKKPAARGGVLGAVGNIAGATLPFTGFPVWLAVLAALALLALGLVLRRGGGTATRL